MEFDSKCLKRNGRHEETRTPDLYRVKAARVGKRLKPDGTDSHRKCPREPRGSLIGPRLDPEYLA
jgi:hypothetical protein